MKSIKLSIAKPGPDHFFHIVNPKTDDYYCGMIPPMFINATVEHPDTESLIAHLKELEENGQICKKCTDHYMKAMSLKEDGTPMPHLAYVIKGHQVSILATTPEEAKDIASKVVQNTPTTKCWIEINSIELNKEEVKTFGFLHMTLAVNFTEQEMKEHNAKKLLQGTTNEKVAKEKNITLYNKNKLLNAIRTLKLE